MKHITAAFIIIGNEILSGRTKDKNLNFLANKLTEKGIDLCEVRVIKDDNQQIVKTINNLREKYDYVFTSGGIGPTHDDITAQAVADAFSVKLIRDPRAVRILKKHYADNELNDARLKMTDLPQDSKLLNNPISSAPGFYKENVFVMAGVPEIMQVMLNAALDTVESGTIIYSNSISAETTEGIIAEYIAKLQKKYKDLEIGSYPYIKNQQLGVSIVMRSSNKDLIEKAKIEYQNFLESRDIKSNETV
jgi:molybdenum cofactor synthesis domain-containing protein